METDTPGDKEIHDKAADSATEPASPGTPSDAVDVKKTSGIVRGLLQGVAELDSWIQRGHTPACFELTEDLAVLAESFVVGDDILAHLEDAARAIKGCAICTEVLEGMVKDMGGTLPRAWQELEPASLETPRPAEKTYDGATEEDPMHSTEIADRQRALVARLKKEYPDIDPVYAAMATLTDPDEIRDFFQGYVYALCDSSAQPRVDAYRHVAYALGSRSEEIKKLWRSAIDFTEWEGGSG